jgi:hypothetical protein
MAARHKTLRHAVLPPAAALFLVALVPRRRVGHPPRAHAWLTTGDGSDHGDALEPAGVDEDQ